MSLSEHDIYLYNKAIKHYVRYNPENALNNIATVRQLSLAADRAITIFSEYRVPSAKISATLLEYVVGTNKAMEWLSRKITVSNTGCWELPLNAEYDSKNRARYPTINSKNFESNGELAHRFVLRRVFGAPLSRHDYWDHICRVHACCNLAHGQIVNHRTNGIRAQIARRAVTGELPLF